MAAELGEVCTEQGWWGRGPRVGVGGGQWDTQGGDWMEDPKGGWSGIVTGPSQGDTGSILWSQTHRSYGLLPPPTQQLEETRASLAPPAPSLSRTVSNKPATPASLFPPHLDPRLAPKPLSCSHFDSPAPLSFQDTPQPNLTLGQG